MPRLKVTHPDMERTEYDFGLQRVTLGREADNLIVIDDIICSRHHAVIENSGGTWWLRDLGSTHGTLHKGSKIKKLQLGDGAVFEIGARKFQFFLKSRGRGRERVGGAIRKHKAKEADAGAGSCNEQKSGAADVQRAASPGSVISDTNRSKSSTDVKASQASANVRFMRRHALAASLLALLALGWGFCRNWEFNTEAALKRPSQPEVEVKAEQQMSTQADSAPVLKPADIERLKASENAPLQQDPKAVQKVAEAMKPEAPLNASAQVQNPAPIQAMAQAQAQAATRKVLYAPLGNSAGFQPVLNPVLDSVLHVQKSADGPWVDVFLNDRRILSEVKIISENQMRFSEDGTAWAVQAEDREGKQFVALQDRRIPAEGKIIQWLGNSDFSHVATVVRRNEEDHLHVDGEWQTSYHHIRDVRLSQDGRKWACVTVRQAGMDSASAGERVITQDGSGAICERVLSLQMDMTGGRVVWLAEHRGGRMALMSGDDCLCEVTAGTGEQIQSAVLSQNGRMAWAVVGNKTDPKFYLEGREPRVLTVLNAAENRLPHASILARPYPATRILFSRDGQHVAFAAVGHSSVVMHDGEIAVTGPVVQLDSLVLSDDGLKVGCVVLEPLEDAQPGKAQLHRARLQATGMMLSVETKVWVRGKSLESTMIVGGISGLCFSPDHLKLAWICSMPSREGKRYVRKVWIGNDRVGTAHENVTSIMWSNPQLLVMADMSLSSDSIEQVIHQLPPVKKP